VMLKESAFDALCAKAGIDADRKAPAGESLAPGFGLEGGGLAEKLVRRRRAAGLSQADLARRAGIRPETLNRIERGHAEPGFGTVRKLVDAIHEAEKTHAASQFK